MKKLLLIVLLICTISARAQTKFGVLVYGKMNLNTKINAAKALGVTYVRAAIIMQNWNGDDQRCDRYTAAGFRIILNVNWGPAGEMGSIPFPTDTVQYKKILGEILDRYKPELVVVENEEIIKKYHSGPIEDYINELTAAIDVCHSKGVKVTNGGLTDKDLSLLVYNDYRERRMDKEAGDFADRCIKPAFLQQNNQELNDMVTKAKTLVEAYKRLPLDYVNIHIYEPIKNIKMATDESVRQITPRAIDEIIAYVKMKTGKNIVSNESGAKTSSPEVVTQMMDAFAKANAGYLIWFSGDAPGGPVALQNDDGSLRPNGIAFRDYVQRHNSNN